MMDTPNKGCGIQILLLLILGAIIAAVETLDATATLKDHVVIALLYLVVLDNSVYSDVLSEIKTSTAKISNALNERDF